MRDLGFRPGLGEAYGLAWSLPTPEAAPKAPTQQCSKHAQAACRARTSALPDNRNSGSQQPVMSFSLPGCRKTLISNPLRIDSGSHMGPGVPPESWHPVPLVRNRSRRIQPAGPHALDTSFLEDICATLSAFFADARANAATKDDEALHGKADDEETRIYPDLHDRWYPAKPL